MMVTIRRSTPMTTPGTDVPDRARVTFLIADLAGSPRHGSGSRRRLGHFALWHWFATAPAAAAERVGIRLIVAPEAVSAVRTAVDLRAATERESLFPLRRLGVHGGPVVELEGSYFGTPLNLTARLATYAVPGQILCTEAVVMAASRLEGVEFRHLGLVALKNILAPVAIFEVVVAAGRTEQADLIDPVCQMRIDPVTSAAQLTQDGRMYHFCSPECVRTFASRVERSGGSAWT
jgi:class 3 adenylate cyclase/YHS domain-containing protein